MINKLISKGFTLASFVLLFACTPEYEALDNAVYFGEAQNVNSKNVTVKAEGAQTNLYLSLAARSGNKVEAEIAVDAKVLEDFNKRNGTNYLLLPESYYSLSTNQCVIEAGKLSSSLVDININAFDDNLEVSEKYAIPVKIASANGANILEASSNMVVLCDKIITTKVLFASGGNTSSSTTLDLGAETVCNSTTWTVEFLTNSKSFSLNRHILSIKDAATGKVEVFGRFGEYDHPFDEIQFKVTNIPFYGLNRFEPNRWYHVALTCDGTTVRLYQDGKLDFAADSSEPNRTYSWNNFTLRCGNPGALSEFRIWNVARTQAEITNNMYAVNPDSEGLEIYWKINEGKGNVAYDYSGNGRDIPLMRGTWKEQTFPPEY